MINDQLSRPACVGQLQTRYSRVFAHSRTLSPDDEMLRILEAMGTLALLTRHKPKDIAHERNRLQDLLEAYLHHSEQAQQSMLGDDHELESRLSELPGEIEAGLIRRRLQRIFGERLLQHILRPGLQDTGSAPQTTSAAMTGA